MKEGNYLQHWWVGCEEVMISGILQEKNEQVVPLFSVLQWLLFPREGSKGELTLRQCCVLLTKMCAINTQYYKRSVITLRFEFKSRFKQNVEY